MSTKSITLIQPSESQSPPGLNPCVVPLVGKRPREFTTIGIKDLPMMAKNTLLILKKRRYACSCGKRFLENYDFLPKYSRMTNRLAAFILSDRKQSHLIDYFKGYSRHERSKVQYFVCDMWAPYAELAKIFFPNASIIVDKYHFIRQISWAVENVRKRIQKKMLPSLRKYFKRSKRLILKRSENLMPDEKEALDVMLLYSDDLRQAYKLKEAFYTICQESRYAVQRKDFYEWIEYAERVNLPEFKACITALRNWSKEILNAFKYGYTNGCTEGFNNKIKVLKRMSYGVRNFKRFRNRILHLNR